MAKRIKQRRKFKKNIWQIIISSYIDLRYGLRLLDDEKYSPFYDIGCYHTQSIEYEELGNIFCKYSFQSNCTITDIGCGRGRLFNYLLFKKYDGKMIGVEIDPEISAFTRKRLKRFNSVEIITGNALSINLPSTTDYFLFCPFNYELTREFVRHIEEIHNHVRVIYYYPIYVDLFLQNPKWSGRKESFWSSIRKMNIDCYYLEYSA